MRYFYDNSTNNPANPSDPPRPVSYGLSSTNEMAELWMIFRLESVEDRALLNEAVLPKLASEIITYSRKLLENDPSNADLWLRIGSAAYALNQMDRAIDALQRAIQFDPRLDEAHYFMGLIAYDSREFGRAQSEFQEAIAINRRNFKAHGYLGLTHLHQGNYDQSEASLLEALSINPEDRVAASNLELLRAVRTGKTPLASPNGE
jgi:tetratricopeptide (TPR) repeat protein